METMRRLFVLLAAVGLLGSAVGCLTMGKCDCDENLGCGSCGICSGVIHKGPIPSKAEPPEALPKPKEKPAERGEAANAPAPTEAAPAPAEGAPGN